MKIIADSTCDINAQDEKLLNIRTIPLQVTFGDKSYKDIVEISKREFFEKLETSEVLPVTSQPTPDLFAEVFKEYKELDEEVILITLASKLSGTHQSAVIAKEMVDYDKIYIVDSATATSGSGILVRLACALRDEGKSAKEIYEILEAKKEKANLIAMVDTLKYLIKGGRVSKAAGAIGGILNVKPIIAVKDGEVLTINKVRGKTGGYNELINQFKSKNVDTDLPITLLHANDEQAMEDLEELLIENGIKYNWSYDEVGSVIGTHAGPGCVGIAFFEK